MKINIIFYRGSNNIDIPFLLKLESVGHSKQLINLILPKPF